MSTNLMLLLTGTSIIKIFYKRNDMVPTILLILILFKPLLNIFEEDF